MEFGALQEIGTSNQEIVPSPPAYADCGAAPPVPAEAASVEVPHVDGPAHEVARPPVTVCEKSCVEPCSRTWRIQSKMLWRAWVCQYVEMGQWTWEPEVAGLM